MKLWGGPGVFSQSKRATNCATPGYSIFCMIPYKDRKSKFFVSVGVAVVKPDFTGVSQLGNFRRKLLLQGYALREMDGASILPKLMRRQFDTLTPNSYL